MSENDGKVLCNGCNRGFAINECYQSNDGEYYCSDCVGENFFKCDECQNIFEKETAIRMDLLSLCPKCSEKHQCSGCGYFKGAMFRFNGEEKRYCNDCLGEFCAECSKCHNLFEKEGMHQVRDNWVCSECFEENYFTCCGCGKTYSLFYFGSKGAEGDEYCRECWQKNQL